MVFPIAYFNNIYIYFLANHISNLENLNDNQLNTLMELVNDLDNISITMNNELKKLTNDRNFVLEDVFNSIYHVSYIIIF